jgi:hypothetical protein
MVDVFCSVEEVECPAALPGYAAVPVARTMGGGFFELPPGGGVTEVVPSPAEGSLRVVRGGMWLYNADALAVTYEIALNLALGAGSVRVFSPGAVGAMSGDQEFRELYIILLPGESLSLERTVGVGNQRVLRRWYDFQDDGGWTHIREFETVGDTGVVVMPAPATGLAHYFPAAMAEEGTSFLAVNTDSVAGDVVMEVDGGAGFVEVDRRVGLPAGDAIVPDSMKDAGLYASMLTLAPSQSLRMSMGAAPTTTPMTAIGSFRTARLSGT